MVRLAESDDDLRACHVVMRQLRPHYADAAEFLARVRLQQQEGYQMGMLECDGRVASVSGFRIGHNLAWGKYLYVDDLITDETSRSAGHGGAMLAWLIARAKEAGCDQLHLDSGVQRFGAHRFYLRAGMDITSHHFAMSLA